MGVLTLEDLQKMKNDGIIIKIPGFNDDEIEVKVKPIDMSAELLDKSSTLYKIAQGDVAEKFRKKQKQNPNNPNIQKDFENEILNNSDDDKIDLMAEMMPEIDQVCKDILIQPTFEEFLEYAPLNVQQKVFLFGWATKGSKKNNRTNRKK